MTDALKLTHKDAFANYEVLEKFGALLKKDVHGFGIRGKKFVLIKRKNSFFSRIWFSFLKFLGVIETDEKAVNRLKEATITHIRDADYKEWAKTHGKVTKVGIKNLISTNQELNDQLRSRLNEEARSASMELKDTTIATLRAEFVASQAENVEFQSEIEELKEKVNTLQQTIEENKNKFEQSNEKIKNRKKHYKNKASSLAKYKAAWMHQNPDTPAKEFVQRWGLLKKVHKK